MSKLPYRVSTPRGANLIAANPQRMERSDGARWATGRNVKRALPGGRYDGVEVWALKDRDEDGRARVVRSGVSRAEAERWIADVTVAGGGTIYTLLPMTDAGREWIDENVQSEPYQWLGRALGVEHRYIGDIVAGMQADGLVVA